MADIAVVTANLGGMDDVHPQREQNVDADWYYFTDGTVPTALSRETPWCPVNVSDRLGQHPRMAAKRFRMEPWAYLPAASWVRTSRGGGGDYRYIIWIDASLEVTSKSFIGEAIAEAQGHPLTTWEHPRRNTVAKELDGAFTEAPEKYARYSVEMVKQLASYKAEGYPIDRPPLYATGTLVWNMDAGPLTDELGVTSDNAAKALGAAWLEETERWAGWQDQLSLPVVAWRLGIQVATFRYAQVKGRHVRPVEGGKKVVELYNRWGIWRDHRRAT